MVKETWTDIRWDIFNVFVLEHLKNVFVPFGTCTLTTDYTIIYPLCHSPLLSLCRRGQGEGEGRTLRSWLILDPMHIRKIWIKSANSSASSEYFSTLRTTFQHFWSLRYDTPQYGVTLTKNLTSPCRWLRRWQYFGKWHRVVWYKATDIPVVLLECRKVASDITDYRDDKDRVHAVALQRWSCLCSYMESWRYTLNDVMTAADI